ncbi:MAG TPA: hypothetical protein VM286_00820 [Candidatus Thermoplasmatota archaeon]|nr:hypothetical protein [Candidatus Thermoplasmatota archaeon]
MGKVWLVVGMALLLSGCVQPPPKDDPYAPKVKVLPPPETFVFDEEACNAYVLGLLVEPSLTDPYLPPGFHMRDPEWFYEDPVPPPPPPQEPLQVATGQALVFILVFKCDAPSEPNAIPFQEAHAGVFVLPPAVRGQTDNATLDFYEIEHYSAGGLLADRLPAWEWPVHNTTFKDGSSAANMFRQTAAPHYVPKNVFDNATADNLREVEFLLSAGDGDPLPGLQEPALFSFGGSTTGVIDYEIPSVRFWHQAKAGLSHIDYILPMAVNLGPGYCSFQDGSILNDLTHVQTCPELRQPDVSDPGGLQAFRPQQTVPFVGYFRTAFRAEALRQQEVYAK